MNATRRLLLSSSSPLPTTPTSTKSFIHQSMVVPQRSNWDTLISASQAIYSILFYPKARDTFVQTIDKGIINPSMLGQLDFGLFMSLALHHDLHSTDSSFSKNKFDAREFVEGSHMAIEQFQECLYTLDKQIIGSIEGELEKRLAKNYDNKNNAAASNDKEEESTNIDPNMTLLSKRLELIEPIVDQEMIKKTNTAEEDEDSLEHQMKQMVSKQFLNAIETQFAASVVQCYVNDMLRMDYKLESSKVVDIALMSARAHEVPPDDEEEGEEEQNEIKHKSNEEKTEIMEDVSFTTSKEHDHDGEDHPVMAQIEILYTISQTFTRKKIGHQIQISSVNNSDIVKKETKTDDDAENNEKNEDDNSSEKENTMESAWVAVFEGWIEGKEPLQWKMVDNRPAWEYPMMTRNIN